MNNLTTSPNTILQCNNLTKVFKDNKHSITVLNQIDFTLHSKERIAIIGASGSGKSTLLHILGCLDHATAGTVRILDNTIRHYNNRQLNQIRNRYIGFIYQFHHLLSDFSLLENVCMPLLIQGEKLDTVQQKALQILHDLDLVQRKDHKPYQVSGGERQRTAIARAMITEPLFILADEPTGNLDKMNANRTIDLLSTLQNTSLIIATHDYTIAGRMDKILRLENGRLAPVDNKLFLSVNP